MLDYQCNIITTTLIFMAYHDNPYVHEICDLNVRWSVDATEDTRNSGMRRRLSDLWGEMRRLLLKITSHKYKCLISDTSFHCVLFLSHDLKKHWPGELALIVIFFLLINLKCCQKCALGFDGNPTTVSFVCELHHSYHLNGARSNCITARVFGIRRKSERKTTKFIWHICRRDLQTFWLPVLLFSSFPFLPPHTAAHIALFCTNTQSHTAVVSSLSAVVPCCRLAVTTPVLGLLFGRKASIGQILFGQIKKSMSSCLH